MVGRRLRRLLAAVLPALVIFLAASCSRREQGAAGGEIVTTSMSGAPVVKLTADLVVPSFSTNGDADTLASVLYIDFPYAMAESSLVGKPLPRASEIRIEPEIPGTWIWDSTSRLRFECSMPPAHASSYGVELLKISTKDGVFSRPSETSWRWTLQTAPFTFVAASIRSYNSQAPSADLVFTFSGPVSLASFRKYVTFSVAGTTISTWSVTQDPSGHPVVQIWGGLLTEGGRLGVRIAKELGSSDGSATLGKDSELSYLLEIRESLDVREVKIQESDSGFYIDVLINDPEEWPAQVRRSRDMWEARCSLNADAISSFVQLSPGLAATMFPTRSGMRIFADFKRGTYALRILAGLASTRGSTLAQEVQRSITIPARKPKLTFLSKGRYLPRELARYIPLSHTNLTEMTLSIDQIYEQNLVAWFSADSEQATRRTSDPVARETYTLKSVDDVPLMSWIDITRLLPSDRGGVFQVTASGGSGRDTLRLNLTNLGLVAKEWGASGESMYLNVFDTTTLKPVGGAQVSVRTVSNRILYEGSTDGQGNLQVEGALDTSLSTNRPFALIVKKDDDVLAVRMEDVRVAKEDYDVEGDSYDAETPYMVHVYSECGVYRPGERASFGVIVRDKSYQAPPEGLPVLAKLNDPRGKVLSIMNGTTNPGGMLEFAAELNPYADTGKYEMAVEIGGSKVGSYAFNVEEFVPERMKVTVTEAGSAFLQAAPVPFRVDARYLFGAPAAEAKVEVSYSLQEGRFAPANNPEYTYSVWRQNPMKPITLGTVSGTLEADGSIQLQSPVIANVADLVGGARLVIDAAVFEAGSGRTTVGRRELLVHPAERYVGLKCSQKTLDYGSEATIAGLVVDLSGNVVKADTQVQLSVTALQSEWVWEYDSSSYKYRYTRYTRLSPMRSEQLAATAGAFSATIKADTYADGYVIEARIGSRIASSVFLKSSSYSEYEYRIARPGMETPRPLQPESVPIEAPRQCRVGETAKVTVRPPYPGRLLLTVEAKGVLESRWLDVEAVATEIPFTVKSFYPNVYVSVYLMRQASTDSSLSFLPGAAFGVVSIPVIPERYQIEPKITVPAEIRPNRSLDVAIDCGANREKAYVTVAVVDEGILQLTKFASPDPLASFFTQRILGVDTFETVGWTLKLPQLRMLSSSGDEAAAKARVMPVKPLVLWSGIREVPANGRLTVSFVIPQYAGQLRVMVAAASPTRSGSADSFVTVRDPIVVQATFPRFLTQGDRFRVPVAVTNLTGKADTFDVSLAYKGGVRLEGSAGQGIRLEAGAEATVSYELVVTEAMGRCDFELAVSGAGESSTQKSTVPIVPNAPVTTETKTVELKGGNNELAGLLPGWQPQYESGTVWLTANRYTEQMSHLKFLIQYPYGCIEQTTSTTRPLLYIGDLVLNLSPAEAASAGIGEKFMFGANRLLSMQMENGAFSYWPGAQQPTYWGTAYATHCLLLGMRQGYPIPKERVEAALSFMERAVDGDQSAIDAKYGYTVAKSKPYMLYVLSLAGRPKVGATTQLLASGGSGWEELAEENTFLLHAALYIAGDRTYESQLKAVETAAQLRRDNGWSFWSSLRTSGLMLDTLVDLFPSDPVCGKLADSIAAVLSGQGYFTTQELSWCVSALGKHVYGAATAGLSGTLTGDGKVIQPLDRGGSTSRQDFFWSVPGTSGYASLLLDARFAAGSRAYASVTLEGIKPGVAYRIGDNSISVSRSLRDPQGNAVDPASLRLGDMVVVELGILNKTGHEILNVALVDRFAAGLEIENPRLNRQLVTGWYDESQLWQTDYMDMKDDRIRWFGKLGAGQTAKLYYVLRAVTRGTFASPPTSAEAMYDPSVWSSVLNPAVSIGGGPSR